jgi:hypothetical protein
LAINEVSQIWNDESENCRFFFYINPQITIWRSVLLVEETGVPRENHRPDANKLKVAIHKNTFHNSAFLHSITHIILQQIYFNTLDL